MHADSDRVLRASAHPTLEAAVLLRGHRGGDDGRRHVARAGGRSRMRRVTVGGRETVCVPQRRHGLPRGARAGTALGSPGQPPLWTRRTYARPLAQRAVLRGAARQVQPRQPRRRDWRPGPGGQVLVAPEARRVVYVSSAVSWRAAHYYLRRLVLGRLGGRRVARRRLLHIRARGLHHDGRLRRHHHRRRHHDHVRRAQLDLAELLLSGRGRDVALSGRGQRQAGCVRQAGACAALLATQADNRAGLSAPGTARTARRT